jgi:hypothetical protein
MRDLVEYLWHILLYRIRDARYSSASDDMRLNESIVSASMILQYYTSTYNTSYDTGGMWYCSIILLHVYDSHYWIHWIIIMRDLGHRTPYSNLTLRHFHRPTIWQSSLSYYSATCALLWEGKLLSNRNLCHLYTIPTAIYSSRTIS